MVGLSFGQLRLQLANPALKLLDPRLDFLLRNPIVDVLWAVDIPGFNAEQDGVLNLARISQR